MGSVEGTKKGPTRNGPRKETRGEKKGAVAMRAILAWALLLVLILANAAAAVLVQGDLNTPGDGLVTRDTDTGLEWLDLTETTNLSYDDVVGGAGGLLAGGWRYATAAQVCDLFEKLGSAPSCPTGTVTVGGNTIANHLNLLGVTLSDADNIGLAGLYDDGTPGDVGFGFANYSISGDQTDLFIEDDQIPSNLPSSTAGSFLVRPFPGKPAPALPFPALASCALVMAAAGLRALRRHTG